MPVNPPEGVTVTEYAAFFLEGTDREPGEAEITKSAADATTSVTYAERTTPPLVPVIASV